MHVEEHLLEWAGSWNHWIRKVKSLFAKQLYYSERNNVSTKGKGKLFSYENLLSLPIKLLSPAWLFGPVHIFTSYVFYYMLV